VEWASLKVHASTDPLCGMHICLVTPGHPSTDPRLVKEADALVAVGARVTVVHGYFLPWAMEADGAFASRAWRRIPVPFGPRAGRATWLRQGVRQRIARAAWTLGLPRHERWLLNGFHPVAEDLARCAALVRADIYIGHNLAGFIAAARAAAEHAAVLGFDAEDDHVGELADEPANAHERKRRDAIQRLMLRHCAHRTAASPRIAQSLAERFGVPFDTVLNVSPQSDVATLEAPVTAIQDSLYWVSQTIGPGRGLEAIVAALARMTYPVSLVLRGMPQRGYVEQFRAQLVRAGGAAVPLAVEPPLPPDQVTASCRGHGLGLSIEIADCRNHDDCLGNKIFHYLLAGTPVLLSDTSAQRELAVELGDAAICVDLADSDALAARLDAWMADRSLRSRASARALALARDHYCWDTEQAKFLQSLRRAVVAARSVHA